MTSIADWFEAHCEFRFPYLRRRSNMAASSSNSRQALEPWHVMGEEGAVGGTVRFVDSSVERLQVKVDGFNRSPAHVSTCNGRRLPLRFDGRPGRGRRRGALQGVAAAIGPASDHRRRRRR